MALSVSRVPVVGLVHEPGAFQILFEPAAAGILLVELAGVGEQFLDVGQPVLILLVVAAGERRAVARRFQHRADDFLHVAVHDGRDAVDDRRHTRRPSPRPPFGKPSISYAAAGRFQQRQAVAIGVLGEPLDRLAADAARRRVHRPLERHVVARIVDQLAVRRARP